MKHEMRVMAAQGGGSIVNLSSVLGKVGAPGAAVYTASKHAVEGLTKAAALEGAASGVRVNASALPEPPKQVFVCGCNPFIAVAAEARSKPASPLLSFALSAMGLTGNRKRRFPSELGAPMTSTIQVLVLLLAVVAAVAIVANRLKIPPSIPLVLTGVLIALVPGLPPVELAPEVVLLLVLPPVIYTSAFQMNWREFRFNLRPITLLVGNPRVNLSAAVSFAAIAKQGRK
jgi:short subunit dehydrogenase/sodium/hydrogen exchanger family protein